MKQIFTSDSDLQTQIKLRVIKSTFFLIENLHKFFIETQEGMELFQFELILPLLSQFTGGNIFPVRHFH